MTNKVDPLKLQEIFIGSLHLSSSFKFIEGLNPFLIRLGKREMYIYIKNISSAYFNNPDVSRVQLPIKEDFDRIKKTDLDFVLLGYDSENDVYATWNPKWAKQRLNIAESVSFYSRFSLQKEAAKNENVKRMQLNNDGEVIVFPRAYVEFVLTHLHRFFKDDSDYVAMGSKKRHEANESYKIFSDSKNIKKMESYMLRKGYSQSAICNYSRCMKVLFAESLINRYRKMFLAYDTIREYLFVVSDFCAQPIIKDLNEKTHNAYSASLRMYIKALIEDEDLEYPTVLSDEAFLHLTKPDDSSVNEVCESLEVVDWETPNTDELGRLTVLTNPALIDKLKPVLDTEYRSLPEALNIVSGFYGDRFPNMQFADWVKLLNAINWKSPYTSPIPKATNPEVNSKTKTKTVNLRVQYPDGRIIQHPKASDTYAIIIETHNPEEINSLNIRHAGINIVQRELDDKYGSAQREISDGWYVFTNTSTPTKRNDLKIISDKLGLNLQVDLISTETGNVVKVEEKECSSNRQKLRVAFPDGRTIQPTKVVEALVEVVKYAGAGRVKELNIVCCADNLILKNPRPRYVGACKPVGEGWLCNTCSDTPTKYEQILHISKSLDLGIKVDIV